MLVLVVHGAQGEDAAKKVWGPESTQRLGLEDLAVPDGEVLGT